MLPLKKEKKDFIGKGRWLTTKGKVLSLDPHHPSKKLGEIHDRDLWALPTPTGTHTYHDTKIS